ncbi:2-keto-4-pentenoate hydratase [Rhizobium sp. AN67]|nr:2-keto-4-pentenoate hydratase [Rhizobium sp. AN67]
MTGMTAIEKLAQGLVKAGLNSSKIALATIEADGLVPEGLEEAIAVQRAFVEASGKTVGGWKLAIRPDGNAVAAPMVDCYRIGDDAIASFPGADIEGIEVEICFTLATDIPSQPPPRSAGPIY